MENKNGFKEKYGAWAMITGGTSGIGEALAYQIAERGLNLILVARDKTKLLAKSEKIKKQFGVEIICIQADLSTNEGIDKVITETQNLKVGFLVLSAGIENNGSFVKIDVQEEIKLIQLNITSTMLLTHHFSKIMIERKQGGILLISSLTAHIPSPYFANYAASKAYVLSFGVSLHAEFLSKGIEVSILSPGLTHTAMSENTSKDIDWSKTPMKFMDANAVAC